jgi:uncharacterized protein (TIGR00297 family)
MSGAWAKLLAGTLLAAIIALAAWRAGSLDRQGALAAAALGAAVFGLGGLGWAILLLGFFLSSSVLSRLFKRRKAGLEDTFAKGTRRDAGQVAANGGIAGLFVLLHALQPGAAWAWVAFAGALAAANSDTWATELGVLSRAAPRRITTGETVERGTSGGVTALGSLAATSGALLIGLLAVLFWQGRVAELPAGAPGWLAGLLTGPSPALTPYLAAAWIGVLTLAGLAGSLLDSLLGATLQAIYFCPACRKETERYPRHRCGSVTQKIRGWPWLNNDWVNALCTLAGALVGLAASALFFS